MKLLLFISFFFLLLINAVRAQKDTTILLHEVKISSSKLQFNSGLKQYTIDSSLLIKYQHLSLSDLLNENSAIFLKNYGPDALSTISLRGGSAYHTTVLWNGFSLTSPTHGLTDLSLENNFLFDDITIQYGGASTLWGSGAVSGSIHLNNTPLFNSGLKVITGFAYGSFSNYSEFAGISFGNSYYSGTLKVFNKNDENNFKYQDENTKAIQEQIHAQINQYGFINENYFRIGKLSVLNLRIWYSFSNRQIPPALLQVNSQALQKDINSRYSAEWKSRTNNTEYILRSAYFHETLNYNDDFLLHPSDNKSKTFITETTIEKSIYVNHTLQLGMNNTYSIADSSSNFNHASVNRFALFTLYGYHSNNEKIECSICARKEFSSLNNTPVTFSSGLNYYPNKNLLLRLAASRVYRNPTLNDLYWNPGGNINLKPENGFSTEGGVQIELFKISGLKNKYPASTLNLNSTVFYKQIYDWIIWYPSSNAVWKPQNLMMVKSRGVEINILYRYKSSIFSAGCDLEFFYTLSSNEKTLVANDASLHQQLIYVPLYRLNGRIFIEYKYFSLNFNHSYTGVRYTSSDNTSYLPPFSLDNLKVDKISKIKSVSLRIFFRVNNIFNTNYQSVLNRPMPLRSFETGISFTFLKNKSSKK